MAVAPSGRGSKAREMTPTSPNLGSGGVEGEDNVIGIDNDARGRSLERALLGVN